MRQDRTTKNGGRKQRSARGAGRLYKRSGGRDYPADNPVNAPYWLAYVIPNPAGGRGQCIRVALHDERGGPITDKTRAEAERKRIVAPYRTGNRIETLKAIQARLQDADASHVQAIEEANPPPPITETWTAYIHSPERPDSGEVTLKQYRGHWERFASWLATAHPGTLALRDVTPAIASDYAGDLAGAGLSANRFNKHVSFLKLLCRVLGDAARIEANPFVRIKRRIIRTHSRREFTIPELTAILDHGTGELGLMLLIGAATGLRLGDVATLQWGEVDLARGIIRRIPNKTAKSGKPVLVGIPPTLHHRLSAIPRTARTGYVLPDMAAKYRRDVALVTNAVKTLIRDCGIDVHAPGTGKRIKRKPDGTPERDKDTGKVVVEDTAKPAIVEVGFHSLRHTWVSMHAARGTPQSVIQASAGHASPYMTAHYTHVNEDTARNVALALPAFTATGDATTPEAKRDPLPAWAREIVESLTAKNVKAVRAELLKGGVA